MDFGVYWESRRGDFPTHELHPPLSDAGVFRLGGPPTLRAWLVSDSGDTVVQIQNDRVYVNWRRRKEEYPHFASHDGREGLRDKALREFELFCAFCQTRIGARPTLQRLELTKIDHLDKGRDFKDLVDLASLLKVTKVFEDVQSSVMNKLRLQLTETVDSGISHLTIDVESERARIEIRHVFTPKETMAALFDEANNHVNRVFFGLLEKSEVEQRFSKEPA